MNAQLPHLSPVTDSDRIQTLDVLRGFALLGILVMNVQSFFMPSATYFFPTVYGDLTGANYWVWYLCEILARKKLMAVFSMLFGAGIVLMHDRATATGRGSAALHYRRMSALWMVGLLHAYLLWDGDILGTYAACGTFLFLFRRARPGRLLAGALLFLVVGSALSLLAGLTAPHWPPGEVASFEADWRPGPSTLAREISTMRGGWIGEIVYRAPRVFDAYTVYFPFHLFWRAGGMMMLGMALYKWGFLSGRARKRTYVALAVSGLLIGVPVTAYGVRQQVASGWDPIYSFFVGSQYGYWGAVALSLAYVSIVVLVARTGSAHSFTMRLAAVGRMAFTNYLMQTIICTTLSYGRGFELFGSVDRVGQAGIVLAVWSAQLIYSPIWMNRFRYGPAEWLWRSLSYRTRQPIRRTAT